MEFILVFVCFSRLFFLLIFHYEMQAYRTLDPHLVIYLSFQVLVLFVSFQFTEHLKMHQRKQLAVDDSCILISLAGFTSIRNSSIALAIGSSGDDCGIAAGCSEQCRIPKERLRCRFENKTAWRHNNTASVLLRRSTAELRKLTKNI